MKTEYQSSGLLDTAPFNRPSSYNLTRGTFLSKTVGIGGGAVQREGERERRRDKVRTGSFLRLLSGT